MQLFEWSEFKNPAYGNYGGKYQCYVSDMLIGTVVVVQAELLSRAEVIATMHKKTESQVACPDGLNQGKAWVQTEFLEWFLATNRLAHAYLAEASKQP